jgi:probable blue pigment (indigoidine) exporter
MRGGQGFAMALLFSAVLCWGGSYRISDIGLERTGSLMLSAFRTWPAAIVLLLVLPFLRGRLPRGRELGWAAVTGLLMVSVFVYGINEGVTRAGPGIAAVLVNTPPFFVLVLSVVVLRERATRVGVAGLAIGFAGVVLIVWKELATTGGSGGSLALGCVLALAAAAAWATGTLVVKRLVERDPGLDLIGFTAVQYAVGGPVLLAAAFADEGSGGTRWGSPWLWLAFAYLALGTSAYGSLAFFAALKSSAIANP